MHARTLRARTLVPPPDIGINFFLTDLGFPMRGQTMSVKKTNLEVCTHACTLRAHCTLHGNIIFDILEQSSFQKYTTCWVFLALCHMLYLCICVFVHLYFCICAFDTWEYHF